MKGLASCTTGAARVAMRTIAGEARAVFGFARRYYLWSTTMPQPRPATGLWTFRKLIPDRINIAFGDDAILFEGV